MVATVTRSNKGYNQLNDTNGFHINFSTDLNMDIIKDYINDEKNSLVIIDPPLPNVNPPKVSVWNTP